ncbi:MAG: hypothetical protein V3S20_01065 [Dehalococcoidia bacterium]
MASGQPQGGPAVKPVPTYRVKVEGGELFLAAGAAAAASTKSG